MSLSSDTKLDFLDVTRIYERYGSELSSAINRVLARGDYIFGKEVLRLEELLADFTGVSFAATVNSGTDALLLALMALNLNPGDEVATTPFTFAATSLSILRAGLVPLFVDIDPHTYLMDPIDLRRKISPKTKAILPVSLFGQMVDVEAFKEIGKEYKIPIIEDAAQSFGAVQNGIPSCGWADISITSFYPTKPLGCFGDGGAIFTSNRDFYDNILLLRNHGTKDKISFEKIGINSRLDTLQAAILIVRMAHLQEELEERKELSKLYFEELEPSKALPISARGNSHIYAQFTLQVDQRSKVEQSLQREGVPTAVHYRKTLLEHPMFEAYKSHCPNALYVKDRVLSIPFHPFLQEREVKKILTATRTALEEAF